MNRWLRSPYKQILEFAMLVMLILGLPGCMALQPAAQPVMAFRDVIGVYPGQVAHGIKMVLEQKPGAEAEVKNNLRLISEQVDRAAKITNQMRELTRRADSVVWRHEKYSVTRRRVNKTTLARKDRRPRWPCRRVARVGSPVLLASWELGVGVR